MKGAWRGNFTEEIFSGALAGLHARPHMPLWIFPIGMRFHAYRLHKALIAPFAHDHIA